MKKYIFLTPNITKVGGAQIYLKTKSDWLTNNGYNVKIISAKKGLININGLEKYDNLIIEKISFYPYYYFKRTFNRILIQILNLIGEKNEEIIIESTSLQIAIWGEIVSKIIGAKHLVYTLQEKNEVYNAEVLDFIKFKNNRKELAGINPQSIPKLFKSHDEKGPYLIAYTSEKPEDYNHPIISKIGRADFTIGSLGRLDKPFLLPVIKEILQFTNEYSDFKFNLLFIGGSENKSNEKKIRKLVKKSRNIKLFITGFVYPVPLKLLKMPDLFITSAGSCYMSIQEQKITISIDANDFKPIGLVGITTDNIIFRKDEPKIELCDLLKDVLIEKKYKLTLLKNKKPISCDYTDHLDFIKKSSRIKSYYSFTFDNSLNLEKKIFFNIFGQRIYNQLHLIKKH